MASSPVVVVSGNTLVNTAFMNQRWQAFPIMLQCLEAPDTDSHLLLVGEIYQQQTCE